MMSPEDLIIRCAKCGTKNRVSKTRLGESPICGKCKNPLKVSGVESSPVNVKDQTFNQEVLSHHGPVLVDCWAPWCGPCKIVGPVLDELAGEYAGRLKIVKLNVDENSGIASRYGIQSIPTMLLFNKGVKVGQLIGAQPKAEIERHIRSIL